MATQWEYTTIGLRIVQRRERGSSFFTHHTMRSNLDDISITELTRAGKEGWELVSLVHVSSTGPGGADYAVGILKRPAAE